VLLQFHLIGFWGKIESNYQQMMNMPASSITAAATSCICPAVQLVWIGGLGEWASARREQILCEPAPRTLTGETYTPIGDGQRI
jgi:hypothetical protein